ncbi:MAG: hypothetical protein ACI9R3_002047 [Verrucomicrobiales bacterium]|jgi:hypothetical protein
MSQVDTFSQLIVARDLDGGFYELLRNELEVVCPAFDSARRCMVELHVLHSGNGTGPAPEVFARQANAAAKIVHSNVTRVFEFGEDEGASFFVSEFVDGELLESYIERCAPLPETLALQLVLSAARGMFACSRSLPVLAGMDLLQSRVRLECATAHALTLKVGGYSFGSRKAETLAAASVHEYYVRSLTEVILWAVTGEQLSIDELTDDDAAHLSVPTLTLLEAMDGNRPAVRTLESAVAAIARTLEALLSTGSTDAQPLSDSLLPWLPLENYLPTKDDLQLTLTEAYELEGDPMDARTPLRMRTADKEQNLTGTVQLLPLDDILPESIQSAWQAAHKRSAESDQSPNLIRLFAYWPSEPAGYFIEEDAGQIFLEDVISWKNGLSPDEATIILEQIEAACRQATDLGLKADLRGASQVVIQFLDADFSVTAATTAKLAGSHLSEWPAFCVKVRTFPTFLSLLRCPPELAVPQRGTDAEEAAAVAWWAQQMLGEATEIPTNLTTLVDDTVTGRPGGIAQTSAEFVCAFRTLAKNIEADSPDIERLDANSSNANRRGKRTLRATQSIELLEDEEYDEEAEVILPGLAEALFQSPGEPPRSPLPDPFADQSESPAVVQGAAETQDTDLIDNDDNQPASAIWLFLVVVIIALLLAAVFAQLSGSAFWLR